MKTIFEKWPLEIPAGGTVTIDLPKAFHLHDSLFMLVHNALNKSLKLTLLAEDGSNTSQLFLLHSFPSILVFAEGENNKGYTRVSFTSFDDFSGSLTYRVKNPQVMMASYRNR